MSAITKAYELVLFCLKDKADGVYKELLLNGFGYSEANKIRCEYGVLIDIIEDKYLTIKKEEL